MKPIYIIAASAAAIGLGWLVVHNWKKKWRQINAPMGKKLGYPDCCIKAFCDQPPQLINLIGVGKDGKMRYDAACVDGEFKGFIPCAEHAKKILNGEITLESLIVNRDPELPPFPNVGAGSEHQ